MTPAAYGGLAGGLGLLAALVALAVWTRVRRDPLSEVRVGPDQVVVDVHVPWVLAYRRRLSAPRSAVTAVRALPPGTKVPYHLRAGGLSWFKLDAGYFWRKGRGFCFVARRPDRGAVEIEVSGGRRVRQWVVETRCADAVVDALLTLPGASVAPVPRPRVGAS